ncbi:MULTISPECIES: ABC transporter permease [unclassified Undibacterium]|uniref:ABC transporter permease n=1 Tax=unclassified Undibacterium TaxID=2630295 RepID=UPI002AC9DDB6|nr:MULTISPECIES: ABC transporter permease [unclassified Undibacterium]MEB0140590.1 ABC transporter permease [Undibacterium sp. CCC2.1]MEB0173644.1 ABC transporter permease [Undibacterium sp. CCC1.1]MEB0177356.1 ABC transporter permease [Undibacterium sp. CCC3.4]MEB0216768.1 ABC transporter permease [Undibacterium sp. 5I2]WPX44554.1 ABC transporter permease [Undibacterium sp. CCC3.4]
MINSIPQSLALRSARRIYLAAFLLFLFLPLTVVVMFAFNDAAYPMPPWHGWTWDWFFADGQHERTGVFFDTELLTSLRYSVQVACAVSLISLVLGTGNAFLLERFRFRGQPALALAMLLPLVIPGVILGISILALMSQLAQFADDYLGLELDFLRPGLVLVTLGQVSYIASIATLTISARLKRFDISLEEAAQNLGASRSAIFFTILLPYLRPALAGAAIMAFLLSFENFNTTYMLTGSDAPLTVMIYGRMKEGATPVVNAISLLLMLVSAVCVIVMSRGKPER